MDAEFDVPTANHPLSDSLLGEYARVAILGTSGCSAAHWAVRLNLSPLAVALVVGNLLVLATLVTTRLSGLGRLVLLLLSATGVGAMTGKSDASDAWFGSVPFFSPIALIACVVLLTTLEVILMAKNSRARISLRLTGVVVLFSFLALYMVVVPSVSAFMDQFKERPSVYTIEELTVLESLRIRSAKFAVFAFFTFFGACIGSFLNVVASGVPKGESVALRSSACPQCGKLISRIDNLPIFSYLNLGGKCRNCDAKIPIRYLVVELISAGIVASLFLFELITGAKNVPGFTHYQFDGILWIIMYTKWDVMGIFFYHVVLMNGLLTLALIERDRQTCPRWFAWSLVILFGALPVAIRTLQPVAFDSQIPLDVSRHMPDWLSRAVTCLIGGCVGYLLGLGFRRLRLIRNSRLLPLAFTLVGLALGWQATFTIGVFFVLAIGLTRFIAKQMNTLDSHTILSKAVRLRSATAILLLVAMIHQPIWKWLAECWS